MANITDKEDNNLFSSANDLFFKSNPFLFDGEDDQDEEAKKRKAREEAAKRLVATDDDIYGTKKPDTPVIAPPPLTTQINPKNLTVSSAEVLGVSEERFKELTGPKRVSVQKESPKTFFFTLQEVESAAGFTLQYVLENRQSVLADYDKLVAEIKSKNAVSTSTYSKALALRVLLGGGEGQDADDKVIKQVKSATRASRNSKYSEATVSQIKTNAIKDIEAEIGPYPTMERIGARELEQKRTNPNMPVPSSLNYTSQEQLEAAREEWRQRARAFLSKNNSSYTLEELQSDAPLTRYEPWMRARGSVVRTSEFDGSKVIINTTPTPLVEPTLRKLAYSLVPTSVGKNKFESAFAEMMDLDNTTPERRSELQEELTSKTEYEDWVKLPGNSGKSFKDFVALKWRGWNSVFSNASAGGAFSVALRNTPSFDVVIDMTDEDAFGTGQSFNETLTSRILDAIGSRTGNFDKDRVMSIMRASNFRYFEYGKRDNRIESAEDADQYGLRFTMGGRLYGNWNVPQIFYIIKSLQMNPNLSDSDAMESATIMRESMESADWLSNATETISLSEQIINGEASEGAVSSLVESTNGLVRSMEGAIPFYRYRAMLTAATRLFQSGKISRNDYLYVYAYVAGKTGIRPDTAQNTTLIPIRPNDLSEAQERFKYLDGGVGNPRYTNQESAPAGQFLIQTVGTLTPSYSVAQNLDIESVRSQRATYAGATDWLTGTIRKITPGKSFIVNKDNSLTIDTTISSWFPSLMSTSDALTPLALVIGGTAITGGMLGWAAPVLGLSASSSIISVPTFILTTGTSTALQAGLAYNQTRWVSPEDRISTIAETVAFSVAFAGFNKWALAKGIDPHKVAIGSSIAEFTFDAYQWAADIPKFTRQEIVKQEDGTFKTVEVVDWKAIVQNSLVTLGGAYFDYGREAFSAGKSIITGDVSASRIGMRTADGQYGVLTRDSKNRWDFQRIKPEFVKELETQGFVFKEVDNKFFADTKAALSPSLADLAFSLGPGPLKTRTRLTREEIGLGSNSEGLMVADSDTGKFVSVSDIFAKSGAINLDEFSSLVTNGDIPSLRGIDITSKSFDMVSGRSEASILNFVSDAGGKTNFLDAVISREGKNMLNSMIENGDLKLDKRGRYELTEQGNSRIESIGKDVKNLTDATSEFAKANRDEYLEDRRTKSESWHRKRDRKLLALGYTNEDISDMRVATKEALISKGSKISRQDYGKFLEENPELKPTNKAKEAYDEYKSKGGEYAEAAETYLNRSGIKPPVSVDASRLSELSDAQREVLAKALATGTMSMDYSGNAFNSPYAYRLTSSDGKTSKVIDFGVEGYKKAMTFLWGQSMENGDIQSADKIAQTLAEYEGIDLNNEEGRVMMSDLMDDYLQLSEDFDVDTAYIRHTNPTKSQYRNALEAIYGPDAAEADREFEAKKREESGAILPGEPSAPAAKPVTKNIKPGATVTGLTKRNFTFDDSTTKYTEVPDFVATDASGMFTAYEKVGDNTWVDATGKTHTKSEVLTRMNQEGVKVGTMTAEQTSALPTTSREVYTQAVVNLAEQIGGQSARDALSTAVLTREEYEENRATLDTKFGSGVINVGNGIILTHIGLEKSDWHFTSAAHALADSQTGRIFLNRNATALVGWLAEQRYGSRELNADMRGSGGFHWEGNILDHLGLSGRVILMPDGSVNLSGMAYSDLRDDALEKGIVGTAEEFDAIVKEIVKSRNTNGTVLINIDYNKMRGRASRGGITIASSLDSTIRHEVVHQILSSDEYKELRRRLTSVVSKTGEDGRISLNGPFNALNNILASKRSAYNNLANKPETLFNEILAHGTNIATIAANLKIDLNNIEEARPFAAAYLELMKEVKAYSQETGNDVYGMLQSFSDSKISDIIEGLINAENQLERSSRGPEAGGREDGRGSDTSFDRQVAESAEPKFSADRSGEFSDWNGSGPKRFTAGRAVTGLPSTLAVPGAADSGATIFAIRRPDGTYPVPLSASASTQDSKPITGTKRLMDLTSDKNAMAKLTSSSFEEFQTWARQKGYDGVFGMDVGLGPDNKYVGILFNKTGSAVTADYFLSNSVDKAWEDKFDALKARMKAKIEESDTEFLKTDIRTDDELDSLIGRTRFISHVMDVDPEMFGIYKFLGRDDFRVYEEFFKNIAEENSVPYSQTFKGKVEDFPILSKWANKRVTRWYNSGLDVNRVRKLVGMEINGQSLNSSQIPDTIKEMAIRVSSEGAYQRPSFKDDSLIAPYVRGAFNNEKSYWEGLKAIVPNPESLGLGELGNFALINGGPDGWITIRPEYRKMWSFKGLDGKNFGSREANLNAIKDAVSSFADYKLKGIQKDIDWIEKNGLNIIAPNLDKNNPSYAESLLRPAYNKFIIQNPDIESRITDIYNKYKEYHSANEDTIRQKALKMWQDRYASQYGKVRDFQKSIKIDKPVLPKFSMDVAKNVVLTQPKISDNVKAINSGEGEYHFSNVEKTNFDTDDRWYFDSDPDFVIDKFDPLSYYVNHNMCQMLLEIMEGRIAPEHEYTYGFSASSIDGLSAYILGKMREVMVTNPALYSKWGNHYGTLIDFVEKASGKSVNELAAFAQLSMQEQDDYSRINQRGFNLSKHFIGMDVRLSLFTTLHETTHRFLGNLFGNNIALALRNINSVTNPLASQEFIDLQYAMFRRGNMMYQQQASDPSRVIHEVSAHGTDATSLDQIGLDYKDPAHMASYAKVYGDLVRFIADNVDVPSAESVAAFLDPLVANEIEKIYGHRLPILGKARRDGETAPIRPLLSSDRESAEIISEAFNNATALVRKLDGTGAVSKSLVGSLGGAVEQLSFSPERENVRNRAILVNGEDYSTASMPSEVRSVFDQLSTRPGGVTQESVRTTIDSKYRGLLRAAQNNLNSHKSKLGASPDSVVEVENKRISYNRPYVGQVVENLETGKITIQTAQNTELASVDGKEFGTVREGLDFLTKSTIASLESDINRYKETLNWAKSDFNITEVFNSADLTDQMLSVNNLPKFSTDVVNNEQHQKMVKFLNWMEGGEGSNFADPEFNEFLEFARNRRYGVTSPVMSDVMDTNLAKEIASEKIEGIPQDSYKRMIGVTINGFNLDSDAIPYRVRESVARKMVSGAERGFETEYFKFKFPSAFRLAMNSYKAHIEWATRNIPGKYKEAYGYITKDGTISINYAEFKASPFVRSLGGKRYGSYAEAETALNNAIIAHNESRLAEDQAALDWIEQNGVKVSTVFSEPKSFEDIERKWGTAYDAAVKDNPYFKDIVEGHYDEYLTRASELADSKEAMEMAEYIKYIDRQWSLKYPTGKTGLGTKLPMFSTDIASVLNPVDGFYSNAEAFLSGVHPLTQTPTGKKLPEKATGAEWNNILSSAPGVKAAELKWSGLSKLFELSSKNTLTLTEIKNFLKDHRVTVNTEVQDGLFTKWSDMDYLWSPGDIDKYVEIQLNIPSLVPGDTAGKFGKKIRLKVQEGHYDVYNNALHVRATVRTDKTGVQHLHVEEIQSDFAQQQRSGKLDKAMPFEQNWMELGMKNALKYAVDNGISKLTWTDSYDQIRRNEGLYRFNTDKIDYSFGDGAANKAQLKRAKANMKNAEKAVEKYKQKLLDTTGPLDVIAGNARIEYTKAKKAYNTAKQEFDRKVANKTVTEADKRNLTKLEFAEGDKYAAFKRAELELDRSWYDEDGEGYKIKNKLDAAKATITYWKRDVDELSNSEGGVKITAYSSDGDEMIDRYVKLNGYTVLNEGNSFSPRVESTLESLVGPEVAKQIRTGGTEYGSVKGNLSIGGSFYKQLYDKQIPGFVSKYLGKFGVTPELTKIDKSTNAWSVSLPTAVKESVTRFGQPMFSTDRAAKNGRPGNLAAENGFYSNIEMALSGFDPISGTPLNKKFQEKAKGSDWLNMISSIPGIKAAEMKWSGLEGLLTDNANKPLTLENIREFVKTGKVHTATLVEQGYSTKWADYDGGKYVLSGPTKRHVEMVLSIPGSLEPGRTSGVNWKESDLPPNARLTTLQPSYGATKWVVEEKQWLNSLNRFSDDYRHQLWSGWYSTPEEAVNSYMKKFSPSYAEPHFVMVDNVVSSVRGSIREATDGVEVLHIDEFQSTLSQNDRENIYDPSQHLPKKIIDAQMEITKLYDSNKDLLNKYGLSFSDETSMYDIDSHLLSKVPADVRNGSRTLTAEDAKAIWDAVPSRYRPQSNELGRYSFTAVDDVIEQWLGFPEQTYKDLSQLSDADSQIKFLGRLLEKYDDMMVTDTRVPESPFHQNWKEVSFKAALKFAVDNNLKRITWTTGAQQTERYTGAMRAVVDEVHYRKPEAVDPTKLSELQAAYDAKLKEFDTLVNEMSRLYIEAGTPEDVAQQMRVKRMDLATRADMAKYGAAMIAVDLNAMKADANTVVVTGMKGGKTVFNETLNTDKTTSIHGRDVTVAGLFGSKMAKQILDPNSPSGVISGDNITIGGEFYTSVYDKAMVSFVNKYLGKYGAKVTKTRLPDHDNWVKEPGTVGKFILAPNQFNEVWSVDIPDEMAESVKRFGQPMFSTDRTTDTKNVDAIEEDILANGVYMTRPNLLTGDQYRDILEKRNFVILSAKQSGMDNKQQKEAHRLMKSELDMLGLSYIEVVGVYGEKERSFLIYDKNNDRKFFEYIAFNRHNQESLITGSGGEYKLVYPNKEESTRSIIIGSDTEPATPTRNGTYAIINGEPISFNIGFTMDAANEKSTTPRKYDDSEATFNTYKEIEEFSQKSGVPIPVFANGAMESLHNMVDSTTGEPLPYNAAISVTADKGVHKVGMYVEDNSMLNGLTKSEIGLLNITDGQFHFIEFDDQEFGSNMERTYGRTAKSAATAMDQTKIKALRDSLINPTDGSTPLNKETIDRVLGQMVDIKSDTTVSGTTINSRLARLSSTLLEQGLTDQHIDTIKQMANIEINRKKKADAYDKLFANLEAKYGRIPLFANFLGRSTYGQSIGSIKFPQRFFRNTTIKNADGTIKDRTKSDGWEVEYLMQQHILQKYAAMGIDLKRPIDPGDNATQEQKDQYLQDMRIWDAKRQAVLQSQMVATAEYYLQNGGSAKHRWNMEFYRRYKHLLNKLSEQEIKDFQSNAGQHFFTLIVAMGSRQSSVEPNFNLAWNIAAELMNMRASIETMSGIAFPKSITELQDTTDTDLKLAVTELRKAVFSYNGWYRVDSDEAKAYADSIGKSVKSKSLAKTAREIDPSIKPNSFGANSRFVYIESKKVEAQRMGQASWFARQMYKPSVVNPNKMMAHDIFGDKIGSFAANLVGMFQYVTADRWMHLYASIMTGGAFTGTFSKESGMTSIRSYVNKVDDYKVAGDDGEPETRTDYDFVAGTVQLATEKYNAKYGADLTPADMQSILWGQILDILVPVTLKGRDTDIYDFLDAYEKNQIAKDYKGPLESEFSNRLFVVDSEKNSLDQRARDQMQGYRSNVKGFNFSTDRVSDIEARNQIVNLSEDRLADGDAEAWEDVARRMVRGGVLADTEVQAIQALAENGNIEGLQKYVLGLNRMSPLELFVNSGRIALLLGVRNVAKNLGGNTLRQFMDELARVPASVFDITMVAFNKAIGGTNFDRSTTSLLTNPAETLKAYKEALTAGVVKGGKEFVEVLKGQDPGIIFEHPSLFRERTTGWKFLRPLEIFEKYGWRFQGAMDRPFNKAAFYRSLTELQYMRMKKEIEAGNDITFEEAEDYLTALDYQLAEQHALHVTFQQDNPIANKYYQLVDGLPPTFRAIITNITKFVKTPLNVVDHIMDYSGFWPMIKLAVREYNTKDWVDWKSSVKKVLDNPQDRKLMSMAISQGMIGSLMLHIGFKLAAAGLLSGFFDREDKKEEEQLQAKGTSFGKLQVGNYSIDVSWLAPNGFYLLAGATMFGTYQKYDEKLTKLEDELAMAREEQDEEKVKRIEMEIQNHKKSSPGEETFTRIMKNIALQTPFLRQIDDIKTSYDQNRLVSGLLEKWISPEAYVPAIVKEIAGSMDPFERVVSDEGILGRMADKVQRNLPTIPGLSTIGSRLQETGIPFVSGFGKLLTGREAMPIRYDMFGKPLQNQTSINPFKGTKVSDDQLVKELDKHNITITKPEGLSAEQENQMRFEKGQYFEPLLRSVIETPDYPGLTDKDKKRVLESAVRFITNNLKSKPSERLSDDDVKFNLSMLPTRESFKSTIRDNPGQILKPVVITDKRVILAFNGANLPPTISINKIIDDIRNTSDMSRFINDKFQYELMVGDKTKRGEAESNFAEFKADPTSAIIRWWAQDRRFRASSDRVNSRREQLAREGKSPAEIESIIRKEASKRAAETRRRLKNFTKVEVTP